MFFQADADFLEYQVLLSALEYKYKSGFLDLHCSEWAEFKLSGSFLNRMRKIFSVLGEFPNFQISKFIKFLIFQFPNSRIPEFPNSRIRKFPNSRISPVSKSGLIPIHHTLFERTYFWVLRLARYIGQPQNPNSMPFLIAQYQKTK